MRLGVRGPHYVITSACASGTMAIGHALRAIRDGRSALALAGGAEAPIVPSVIAAWCSMRVVSRRNDDPARACRPFSADRDGLVLGEGAGILVLEDLERARARGARVYAEVLGFGETSDAGHITAPSLEGEVGAIRRALADARLGPGDVDHVNAHGTATAVNDRTETAALKEALGERARAIPISATKSMLGHAIGAGGAIEAAATALALARGEVHPTANYTSRDPDCDLDYVIEGARRAQLRAALKTSFAFGGANAVLVLGRADR
jgi:3-oxoacyl-[acyl-carrier-protein] synthase II